MGSIEKAATALGGLSPGGLLTKEQGAAFASLTVADASAALRRTFKVAWMPVSVDQIAAFRSKATDRARRVSVLAQIAQMRRNKVDRYLTTGRGSKTVAKRIEQVLVTYGVTKADLVPGKAA